MIRIYKPSRSMRSNYRPLEFLICFSLTLCCLWSSTFIKSPMWLCRLIGTSWRLSLNAIAVCLLTFVFKDTRKASSRTHFRCLFDSILCLTSPLSYRISLFSIILAMLTTLLLVTFAKWTHGIPMKNRVVFVFSPSCSFGGRWEGWELWGGLHLC